MFYGFSRLDDILKKGNVWYVNHYETYFDKVYVIYLSGGRHEPMTKDNTTLVSLGTGSKALNLVVAPFRLYRFARSLGSCSYLTCDQVFSWWTSLLLVSLLGARIVLMPVCIPKEIYARTGRSLTSVLPIWLERLFIRWSYVLASRVVTGKNIGVYIEWLSSMDSVRTKLQIVDVLVEELPSTDFFQTLSGYRDECNRLFSGRESEHILLYVGRLHREKLVADLIHVLRIIVQAGLNARLVLIGDGEEKTGLQTLADQLDVRERVVFAGSKKSAELVDYYKSADVFLSTLTGTSLREAALCGLPVVAYRIDWVRGILKDEENALLAENGDIEMLAKQAMRVLADSQIRGNIARNLQSLAETIWTPDALAVSLEKTFAFEASDVSGCFINK